MSGGSFNYIENWFWANGLPLETLQEVADFLKEQQEEFAASEIESLIRSSEALKKKWEELGPVMHAAEWHASGDTGSDQMKEALRKWREERKR